MSELPEGLDPMAAAMLTAGVDLIGRTGASSTQVRFDDSEPPTVWLAVAAYVRDGRDIFEAAGAMHPTTAVLRLCEQLIDGAVCVHCERPTGFEPSSLDAMPLDALVCWYQWDPELKVFRRGCE